AQYADDERVSRLAAEVRRRLLDDGYGSTIAEWVHGLAESCDQRELGRLEQLVAFAYQWDNRPTLRPADFVHFVETARSERPGQGAIRVMTIHQAKGLEFDIVVLAELDEKFLKQTPRIVVQRPRPFDPIDRVCAYPNKTVQSVLPDSLRELVRHWQTQAVNEALCVLYVAMTRAIHALYLVIPPGDKTGENTPSTYAGLIHAALADGQPLTHHIDPYQCGDPDWDDQAVGPSEPPADEKPAEQAVAGEADASERSTVSTPTETASAAGEELTPLKLADSPSRLRRGLARTAPSKAKGTSQVDIRRVLFATNAASTVRGRLLHAWLEEIEWVDDGEPDDERLRQVATCIDSRVPDLENEIVAFREMLQQPTIRRTLSRQGYSDLRELGLPAPLISELAGEKLELEVHRELPFALRQDAELVNGIMDRVVVLKVGGRPVAADVIDFKSDKFSEKGAYTIDEAVEHYAPQLLIYREAVSRLFRLPVDHVTTRLLFLTVGALRCVK
ncbi:MAG: hypothetical protein GXP27_18680, partial [Planctomycetes bacterium]|nr:hypothetical protein [Planctomycetota bacterium]